MSRKVYRTNLGEHAQDVPLVFANEPKPVVGKGGKAFKSLTAAVKAAELERDACRGYKVATEEVLEAACKKLREVEVVWRAQRRAAVLLVWLMALLFVGVVVVGFLLS